MISVPSQSCIHPTRLIIVTGHCHSDESRGGSWVPCPPPFQKATLLKEYRASVCDSEIDLATLPEVILYSQLIIRMLL